MKLIDADALNIDELCRLRSDLKSGLVVGSTLRYQSQIDKYIKALDEIIDRAPTVFSCNACKNMGNERECIDCHDYSNYVHYEERPQGEWIVQRLQNGFDDVYCPFCIARPTRSQYGYYLKDNFCHECGADMRKGGAE